MSEQPTAASDLLELLTSWQRDLAVQDVSKLTLKTYGGSIRALSAYLAGLDEPPAALEDITGDHIKDWMLALRAEGKAESTISTRFANTRSFFNWLVREGDLDANPMNGIKQPRAKEQPVPVVSPDDLRKILDSCDSSYDGRRDEAMIRAFVDGGMRLGELVRLDLDDLDMEQQVFWVHGKGGRKRAVPFGMRTARALDRYMRARRRHPKTRDSPTRLWIGRVGPLTPFGVEMMIARRGKHAGFERLRPHQLRHTSAHQLRLAGMNDQDMKRIFGWRSSKMLERYGASAADERAREAHRRLSFGDQL